MSSFVTLVVTMSIVLWIVLAYVVGSHATGHDRSKKFWFVAVLVTGTFGAIFYLLMITSEDSDPADYVPDSATGVGDVDHRVRTQKALFLAIQAHLCQHAVVTKTGLQNAIYPEYPVGYDSPAEWYSEFVRPELENRDLFETVAGLDDGWTLADDE